MIIKTPNVPRLVNCAFSERLAVPQRVPSGVPPVEVQLQPVEVGALVGVHRLVLLLGNSKQSVAAAWLALAAWLAGWLAEWPAGWLAWWLPGWLAH